jgi:hypothetical protein
MIGDELGGIEHVDCAANGVGLKQEWHTHPVKSTRTESATPSLSESTGDAGVLVGAHRSKPSGPSPANAAAVPAPSRPVMVAPTFSSSTSKATCSARLSAWTCDSTNGVGSVPSVAHAPAPSNNATAMHERLHDLRGDVT